MLTDEDLLRRVTVVTVTYNSEAVIAECLRHLPPDVAAIVVDNASADRTVEVALAQRPATTVYRLRHNVGYGRANNFALRRIDTEFALLLNPDGFITAKNLAALVRVAMANPDYGLVAPELSWTDRERAMRPPADSPALAQEAERAGAIVLLRMAAGAEVGFFDEDFFLYGEDNDLCTSVRQAGWKLGIVNGIVGFHQGNASSGYEPGLQLRKNILMGRASTHYRRKWRGGRLWWVLVAWRVVEHSVKAVVNLLRLRRARAGWHLGRVIGSVLYLATSSTGPDDRPELVAALGGAAATEAESRPT